MKEEFEDYLLYLGYKETTPSGLPSTVPQYINAIDKIVQWEHLGNWEQLISRLPILFHEYGVGGQKAHLGARGHNTVINALYRFAEFISTKMN